MTVTDQIKILDRKNLQNEAQYDLDRKAAKISVLSSNNFDKYEYLTGEDLDLKPTTVEKARFEYSPMSKVFNNGLTEEDKKEGLLKRLRNTEAKKRNAIKDQGKKQLNAIKNIHIGSKPVAYFSKITPEAKELMNELREEENFIDNKRLLCAKTDGTIYDFTVLKGSIKFDSVISNKDSLNDAKDSQNNMLVMLNNLEKYNPKNLKKVKPREETLANAGILHDDRNKIINAFENGVFLLKRKVV